jgi:hypothetical protein
MKCIVKSPVKKRKTVGIIPTVFYQVDNINMFTNYQQENNQQEIDSDIRQLQQQTTNYELAKAFSINPFI